MRLARLIRLLAARSGMTLVTASGLMIIAQAVIILGLVALRRVIHGLTGEAWAWPLDSCDVMMWGITYLSLGYIWRRGGHVRVRLVLDHIQGKWRQAVEWSVGLICLGTASVMLWGAFNAFWTAWSETKLSTSEFPEYLFAWILPLGIAILVLEVGYSVIRGALHRQIPG